MRTALGRHGECQPIKSLYMHMHVTGSSGNPDMSVRRRNVFFGGKVKVVTYHVGKRLCDKYRHPLETYIIMHMDGMYDTATVCHKTIKDALRFHRDCSNMMLEVQNEQ